MTNNAQSPSADELRKAGKYTEAIPLYKEMVKTSQSSYPTRWLINCLRKSGQLDEALTTGQQALQKFPQDRYLRSEMAWVIYDKDLKPGREAGDVGRVINAARRALELDPENDLLRKTACLAVMKTAKKANNPNWPIIAEFADMIDPATLSGEKRKSSDGKAYMSEKEDWFVNASHAHLKCGEFQEAIEIATQGLRDFPNEIFLTRTIALAQFRSGDTQAATQTMRPLLNHPRCDWYIRSELAEMEMQIGNTEEAYRLLCQALLTRQDDQFKVNNLELFAELTLGMEKLEEACTALAFARAVRAGAGWSIPSSLTQLEEKCRQSYAQAGKTQPVLPTTQKELSQVCYKMWKDGAAEGMERFRGKVTGVRPDRKYAFIQPQDGGESVIVFERDLPRDCANDGTLVEYSREKSFDVKKNRDSFKAVQVRKI